MPTIISLILPGITEEIQETNSRCTCSFHHKPCTFQHFPLMTKGEKEREESVWRNWVHFNKWPHFHKLILSRQQFIREHASLLSLSSRLLYWDLYFNIHLSGCCGDTQRVEGPLPTLFIIHKAGRMLRFYQARDFDSPRSLDFCLK